MTWKIEEVPELRGYTVEWAEPGNYYLSRRNSIYHSEHLNRPFSKIADIHAPAWRSTISRFRLAQRLLRFQVTNAISLPSGELFVTFDKTVGVVQGGIYNSLPGLFRPCRVLRSGCAVDERGDVFFGEYLANDTRGEVHVYRYRSGSGKLEIVHTFPPGSARHVHGVYFDEIGNALYCLTGDRPEECRITKTSDQFKTLQVVGEGNETWRAVSMLFSPDAIYYGTDAEFRSNNIFRCDRVSGDRSVLGEVSGTVFYSKQLGEDLFFTTTAENAPSQTENVAAIWHAEKGECRAITKFKKDRWHTDIFQFGTVHFPAVNKLPDRLYFHLVAVEGDNRTFVISR